MHLIRPIRPLIPRERLLRLGDVEIAVGLRKSSIYTLMRQGRFPKCVRLTSRAVAWRESDVAAWIEGRITEAQAAPSIARGASHEPLRCAPTAHHLPIGGSGP